MIRLNPLNDFLFQEILGRKGDETQLMGFLNAVLRRTGKDHVESVEILEGKDLPAEEKDGKFGKLDVLARTVDGTKFNIEVQNKNEYNMEKRSLYYWCRKFVRGIGSGEDYIDLPGVIAINILDFGYIPLDDFHTSFHIWEDRHKEYMLTDVLEIHFLDMVRFRRFKEKDILNDPLHRWLIYLNEASPLELVEEVLHMDPFIQITQEQMEIIARDPDMMRRYESLEKAAMDYTSNMNGAMRKGEQKAAVKIAKKLLTKGESVEFVMDITGLDGKTIAAIADKKK
jgi:predicted transposase/invertase (TIGR01784 family)